METSAGELEGHLGHMSVITQQASRAGAPGDRLEVSKSPKRVHPRPQLFKAGPTAAFRGGEADGKGKCGQFCHVLRLFAGHNDVIQVELLLVSGRLNKGMTTMTFLPSSFLIIKR